MEIKEILARKISYQLGVQGSLTSVVEIGETLEWIRNGKYKKQIIQLRNYLEKGDKINYDVNKKKLPAVTYSALFNGERRRQSLLQYQENVVLDIDKLNDIQLEEVHSKLKLEDYVFCFWLSPSGNGFKGLVQLEFNFEDSIISIEEKHKMAFNQLNEYFKKVHEIELDKSGSDTTRLCFLSYDEGLVLKENLKPFIIKKEEKKSIKNRVSIKPNKNISTKFQLYNSLGKDSANNRKLIRQIIKFLKREKKSITYSYNDWYRVALAIASSFTFDIGLKYFLELSELDKEKFNESESRELLLNCYKTTRGEITFGAIFHLAKEKGFEFKIKA